MLQLLDLAADRTLAEIGSVAAAVKLPVSATIENVWSVCRGGKRVCSKTGFKGLLRDGDRDI